MLLRRIKDDSGKANEQDYDDFHHDEGRKRQDDFSVDVRNLVDAPRSRVNLFRGKPRQHGWKNQQRKGCIGDL